MHNIDKLVTMGLRIKINDLKTNLLHVVHQDRLHLDLKYCDDFL